ncbi:hypothetical protein XELAEV_18035101mg [Xenopus laevis]|uniref:Uncharacterized protein n=1 Tax=Xenopus laevis TaxID=8355 RepID=A0A974CGD9_XENLA|nr:hypothetical protein XELAEV_18035101mg [Xenopus laevis]
MTLMLAVACLFLWLAITYLRCYRRWYGYVKWGFECPKLLTDAVGDKCKGYACCGCPFGVEVWPLSEFSLALNVLK